jgi:hypothetical protein
LDGDARVEGVLLQLRDRDPDDVRVELPEHVGDEIVRHRPRSRGALELHQDRRRFRMTDPDRQELVPVRRLQ